LDLVVLALVMEVSLGAAIIVSFLLLEPFVAY
jgi:hypothetical protein